jgi:hypothetical protein
VTGPEPRAGERAADVAAADDGDHAPAGGPPRLGLAVTGRSPADSEREGSSLTPHERQLDPEHRERFEVARPREALQRDGLEAEVRHEAHRHVDGGGVVARDGHHRAPVPVPRVCHVLEPRRVKRFHDAGVLRE